jgi:ribonuclease J
MLLTVHRGAKEIGGTCIEVQSGPTRLVLDVGLPLVDANRDPFDSLRALRASKEELIANGTIPKVKGLFTEDGPPPDAILLSHAHLDHVGLVHHSRPQVPVYATSGTSKMMLAGALFARRPSLSKDRHRPIEPGVPFTVGDFRITPFAVDHSTFGCLAFLLEAEGKSLLYSGDLRMHGRKPGMMKTLVDAIAPRNIDVLLMEGTHLGEDKPPGIKEFAVEEHVVDLVRSAPGLVLAAFSPQDVDRLVTFYRAAQRSGRIFVVDAYAALVLHLVSGEARIPRPKRKHGIRVYFNAAFRRRRIEKLVKLFEPDQIELDEILANPNGFLMTFRPSMTSFDFEGMLPPRSLVVYSYWAGYLRNADWKELQTQVKDIGGTFVQAHASGHIHTDDLAKLVIDLNAGTVIPIHTFEPKAFLSLFRNAAILGNGEPLILP